MVFELDPTWYPSSNLTPTSTPCLASHDNNAALQLCVPISSALFPKALSSSLAHAPASWLESGLFDQPPLESGAGMKAMPGPISKSSASLSCLHCSHQHLGPKCLSGAVSGKNLVRCAAVTLVFAFLVLPWTYPDPSGVIFHTSSSIHMRSPHRARA